MSTLEENGVPVRTGNKGLDSMLTAAGLLESEERFDELLAAHLTREQAVRLMQGERDEQAFEHAKGCDCCAATIQEVKGPLKKKFFRAFMERKRN